MLHDFSFHTPDELLPGLLKTARGATMTKTALPVDLLRSHPHHCRLALRARLAPAAEDRSGSPMPPGSGPGKKGPANRGRYAYPRRPANPIGRFGYSATAAPAETPHVSFVSEYVRELRTNENNRELAEKEIAQEKGNPFPAMREATPLIFATLIDPNPRIRRRDTAEVAGDSGAGTLDRLALAALPFARHQAVAR
jgi:hypothetical protein